MWNTEYTFSIVETALIAKAVHTSYGYVRHCPSVKLIGSARGDKDFELVWMSTDELLADLGTYTSAVAANEALSTEATETNRAEPLVQGSNNRS